MITTGSFVNISNSEIEPSSSMVVDSYLPCGGNENKEHTKVSTQRKIPTRDDVDLVDFTQFQLDDDDSWLCPVPIASKDLDISSWLQDASTVDARTRRALSHKLDDIVRSSRRSMTPSVIRTVNDNMAKTVTVVKNRPSISDSVTKTYKINRTITVDKEELIGSACSPRKLSYDEVVDSNPRLLDSDLNYPHKFIPNRTLSFGESPTADINQIRLLASKQEQDLRNSSQRSQLVHTTLRRKLSSELNGANSGDVKSNHLTSNQLPYVQDREALTQENFQRPGVPKDPAIQKSLPNLTNGNVQISSNTANGSNVVQNSDKDQQHPLSASASEKGSVVNVDTKLQRNSITPSPSSHQMTGAYSNANEFKRPTSAFSRLPTPTAAFKTRLPMPSTIGRLSSAGPRTVSAKIAVPVIKPLTGSQQHKTVNKNRLNQTCSIMHESWKDGCI